MKRRVLVLALLASFASFVFADERGDAEKNLEKALAAQSKADVKTALAAATKAGDARAAKLIVNNALKCRGLGVHDELLAAIKGVTEEAGVKELASAAKSSSQVDLRYLLVEGLALQGSDLAQKAVIDALDDKDDTVSTIAARSARVMRTPETIERLIARLEKAEGKREEATLAREITGALVSLTGQDLSFALEWKGWWQSHKAGWKAPEGPKADSGSGTTVVDRLKKNRPEDARTIERLGDDDVIVVKGKSDQISDVLKAVKIKHKEISADEFAKLKLDPKSVLVLNCNSKLNPYGEADFARIREFVEKGGYLFTSDWQLEFLVSKVFPGSISMDKKVGKEDLIMPIRPGPTKNPLMRDVFPITTWDADKFVWHLDSWSELIKIESPGVEVLVESPELLTKFKNGAVAVAFRWKNGKVVTGNSGRAATGPGGKPEPQGGLVVHVLGHFKHQKDKDSGDHFALQQLLLNLFLEKKRAASN